MATLERKLRDFQRVRLELVDQGILLRQTLERLAEMLQPSEPDRARFQEWRASWETFTDTIARPNVTPPSLSCDGEGVANNDGEAKELSTSVPGVSACVTLEKQPAEVRRDIERMLENFIKAHRCVTELATQALIAFDCMVDVGSEVKRWRRSWLAHIDQVVPENVKQPSAVMPLPEDSWFRGSWSSERGASAEGVLPVDTRAIVPFESRQQMLSGSDTEWEASSQAVGAPSAEEATQGSSFVAQLQTSGAPCASGSSNFRRILRAQAKENCEDSCSNFGATGVCDILRRLRVVRQLPCGSRCMRFGADLFQIVPDEVPSHAGKSAIVECYAVQKLVDTVVGPDSFDRHPAVGYAGCFGQSSGDAARSLFKVSMWHNKNPHFFRVFSVREQGPQTFVYRHVPDEMTLTRSPDDWTRIQLLAEGERCKGPTNLYRQVVLSLGSARRWREAKITSQEDLQSQLSHRRKVYLESCSVSRKRRRDREEEE